MFPDSDPVVLKLNVVLFRGSAIAKIIGANTRNHPDLFEEIVKIYVYEELVNGRKLTEVINQDHENLKYLPGHKLPTNIVSSCLN